jgi:hypothetical protein
MDLTFSLVIAGAGIIIGLLLGFMINSLRGDSSKRSSTASEGTPSNIDNILLWHDRDSGNLIVDLDGSTFTRSDQMRSDQLARLETCHGQLKRFLGIQETPPQAATPATATQPPTWKPLAEASQPEPVSIVPPAAVDKKGSKRPLPEPIKPLNIIGEIDEILQEMITSTPLEEQKLKLAETPAHTISVWIGKQQYQSIDEVPDDNIKQVLHAAVKKWEDKTS